MKKAILLAWLLAWNCAWCDAFKIAEVRTEGIDGTERLDYAHDKAVEALFVDKKPVLTVDDVEFATPSPASAGAISIKLKPEGGAKLRKTTERMHVGVDRLAIVIDGKIHSAPVLRGEILDDQFELSGLDELDARGLENLARRISGRPVLKDEEVLVPPPKPAKQETKPYTDDEYRRLKKEREELGLFYLDAIPSEEDLNAKLHKGMSQEEVIAAFGKPTRGMKIPQDADFNLSYNVAAERLPENLKREVIPVGFIVNFTEGKVVGWSREFSNWMREEKPLQRSPRVLKATYPKIDFSDENVNLVDFFEGIKIEDPRQKITVADLGDLLSLASLVSKAPELNKRTDVSANCDVMRALMHHFPEVVNLREKATPDRVPLLPLAKTLAPYYTGEKLWPTPPDKILPSELALPAEKAK